ncbi:MAG: M12 family metallopeptidase [Chthoniobacteraceae bacterium]
MIARLAFGLMLLAALALVPTAARANGPQELASYDELLAFVPEEQPTIALGDMIVPVETVRLWRDQLANTPRLTADPASQTGINKWTGGNVFYAFNANVSTAHQAAFLDGAREWETFANLHFIARTTEPNYIMVNDGGPGLSGGNSALGMTGGEQQLNIGATSWNRTTIVHELGHALGLIHEHQRSDRDTYVTINFSNVPGGASDGNFVLIPTSTNQGAYDFFSVMHYGRKTFAINPTIDTITPKPAYAQFIDVMGGGYLDRALSRGDRNGIALLYGAGPALTTVVTNTKDSGVGSLRTAIYRALDIVTDTPFSTPTITFQIPNTDPNFSGSVFTIRPTDRLPAPGPRTTIDATTQAAFIGDTNPQGPEVVLDGALQSSELSTYGLGLLLVEANVTIRGLVISGFNTRGILVSGAGGTGCTIAGCYIGTNETGTAASANSFSGIEISGGASANMIGGTTTAARNVISGNLNQGVFVDGSGTTGNVIAGNFIGTNAAGTAPVANGFAGIEISQGAGANTVGAGNLISGNASQGIAIIGANGNVVAGNLIGLNAAGTAALPNSYAGVEMFGGATNNIVGGTSAGAGNVLSGNLGQGVALTGDGTTGNVIAGNFIGTNPAGTAAIGNGTAASRYSGIGIFSGAAANFIGGTAPGARNLISGNTGQGIYIADGGTNSNVIIGNWIGLNAAGTAAVKNEWSGVEIGGGTHGNIVGGASAAARNVISGNQLQGVAINGMSTTANVISGNYIGTNPAGSVALGNGWPGVEIYSDASANTIGGAAAGAGNVISGNGVRNVTIAGANNNLFSGNLIGLNAAGTAALANGGPGIQIFAGAQGNTIGSTSGGRNFIAGNNGAGVTISGNPTNGNTIIGNSIGVAPAGDLVANTSEGIALFADGSGGPQGTNIGGAAHGAANLIAGNGYAGIAIYNEGTMNNRISGNSITANGGLGIDIWGDGVTANDAGDADAGPNNLQNAPVLSSAVLGVATTVAGTLNSSAGTKFCIEFFESSTGDPSGSGEGQNFIGAIDLTTIGNNATFNTALPAIVPAGHVISATATDPAGNTSEFSQNVTVTTTDTDGDGMPNAYETAHGLLTNFNDANLDADGDGMSNLAEFRAGTDPRNPSSVLRLGAPAVGSGAITLSLGGMIGRTYRVEFADHLEAPVSWRILADQISGAAAPIPVLDPGGAGQPRRYYRATVRP